MLQLHQAVYPAKRPFEKWLVWCVFVGGDPCLRGVRIPTYPDSHSNDIRTVIPEYPDRLTRRL